MAGLVPLLSHLGPPRGVSGPQARPLQPRFDERSGSGSPTWRRCRRTRHVYPLRARACSATSPTSSPSAPADGRDPGSYVVPLLKAVKRWKRDAAASALFFVDVGEKLVVWDLRPGARRPLTVLDSLARVLYLACDAVSDARTLAAAAHAGTDTAVDAHDVERALAPLVADGLVLRAGSRFLALATRLGDGALPAEAILRFRVLARALGRKVRHSLVVPLHNARDGEIPRSAAGETRRKVVRRGRPAARPRLSEDRFSLNRRGELVIG